MNFTNRDRVEEEIWFEMFSGLADQLLSVSGIMANCEPDDHVREHVEDQIFSIENEILWEMYK
jgi:hypothetical protein